MHKIHTLIHHTVRTFSLVTQHAKKPPTNLEVSVEHGLKADDQRLVNLYSATFLKEEPMVKAAGIQDLTDLRNFVSKALENQHSVLLTDRGNGEVVAAASCGPVTYNTDAHLRLFAESSMKDVGSQRLVNLWASVMSEAKLLDHLHVPAIWDVSFLATAPHMRRLGLARFLVSQQRRLATKLGYSALSFYSACPKAARLAQKMRCQSLKGRPLDSYRDLTGKPWVAGEGQVEIFYCVLKPKGGYTQDWRDVTTQSSLPDFNE